MQRERERERERERDRDRDRNKESVKVVLRSRLFLYIISIIYNCVQIFGVSKIFLFIYLKDQCQISTK